MRLLTESEVAEMARTYIQQRQWRFQQRLPFTWTTLRDKHCWHSIATMGVVDMFQLYELIAQIKPQMSSCQYSLRNYLDSIQDLFFFQL